MAKRRPDRVIQIKEGKWYRHGNHLFEQCCDCGLIHKVEYKLEAGMLFERCWRDDKTTRQVRRSLGISIKKDPAPKKKR